MDIRLIDHIKIDVWTKDGKHYHFDEGGIVLPKAIDWLEMMEMRR